MIGNRVYQGDTVCVNGICRPMTEKEAYELAIWKQNFQIKMKNMKKDMKKKADDFKSKMMDWKKNFMSQFKNIDSEEK